MSISILSAIIPSLLVGCMTFLYFRDRNTITFSVVTAYFPLEDKPLSGLACQRFTLKNESLKHLEGVRLKIEGITSVPRIGKHSGKTIGDVSVDYNLDLKNISVEIKEFPSKEVVEIEVLYSAHFRIELGRVSGGGNKFVVLESETARLRLVNRILQSLVAALVVGLSVFFGYSFV